MIIIMAWRNIWRNKARSLIIMLSIMLGLFAALSVVAIYKGMMRARVRTVIDRETGHLQLHHPQFKEDYMAAFILQQQSDLDYIDKLQEVKATTRRTVTNGMLSTATGSSGVTIYGVVPDEEKLISQLNKIIVEGNYLTDEIRNPVLIGKKLAKKMKLNLKSKLVLMFTDSTNNMVSASFRVAGIYESENSSRDERFVYVNRDGLNALLGIGKASHEEVVILNHDEDLDNTLTALRAMYPTLQIESWEDLSPETELMVDTVNQYAYIMLIIIMLALAFGIVNTMLMAILERTRELGMLLALGMNKVKLFFLIFSETVFLTLAGCPFGLVLSWFAIDHFNRHGMNLSIFGDEMMSSFGFSPLVYPEFPYDKVIGMLFIVVVTALLSSLLPAIKALRLRPVEALRK